MNRSREPKSVLQRGAAETIRPEARDDHGVWLTPWGWDDTVTYPVARYAAQEQQYESPADGYLLPGYAALAPQSVHLEYMWGSLSSKKLAIFFYVGHGHPNELDLLGTRAMVLRGGEGQDVPGQVRHVGNLPDGALDRMALVVLLSCASYRADETGARLPDSFIDKGADTVVSFDTDDHGEGQLYIEHANYWARAFWTYLMRGAIPGQPMSVEAAATAAVEAVSAAVEHEPPELPPAGRDNYGNVTRRHVERVQSDTPLRRARWGR